MVSVIIPSYNPGDRIRKCLDSLLCQTLNELEIIIIDDGSNDGSEKICDEYAAADKRIKVIHQKNSGVSAARNRGLQEAGGDYIAFVDSDDTVKPDMYKAITAIAEESGAELVTSDFLYNGSVIKNSMPPDRLIEKQEIFETVLPRFTMQNSIGTMEFKNKIFSKKFLSDNSLCFDTGLCFQEDLMFMINVYARLGKLWYHDEAYYEYFPAAGGLYSSYRENSGERFIYARQKMLELMKKYEMVNLDLDNFNSSFLYNITYYIYRTQSYVKDKAKAKKLIGDVLSSQILIDCCNEMLPTAVSFDRRIAAAITQRKPKKAVRLINFNFSDKKEKLLKLYSKLRH